ncbi:hypothetical protein HF283_17910, partial [Acidithiobacillus ferrooxidans]|nr:hypothetical protein [Acidithiobacillus ferrooxidans]
MNKALPARATAKIAPWLDALKAARAAGWTWAELAERLPADLELSVKQIAQAVMRCKYSVPQVPLPGLAGVYRTPDKQRMEPAGQHRPLPADGSRGDDDGQAR